MMYESTLIPKANVADEHIPSHLYWLYQVWAEQMEEMWVGQLSVGLEHEPILITAESVRRACV